MAFVEFLFVCLGRIYGVEPRIGASFFCFFLGFLGTSASFVFFFWVFFLGSFVFFLGFLGSNFGKWNLKKI